MTVSIDATNLVLIDAGDSITGWTSSMGGLNTTSLATREGGTSIQDQASQEQYNVYHTITSEDYSDRTIFGWTRSGGPSSEGDASGAGFSMYLGDGTNNRAYDVGGIDNFAFFYLGWSNFRLNTAGLPTGFVQDGGGAPTVATITRVGYGGQFPAKAAGNSDNVAFDVIRYCSNTNPALLVEGGTTGARGTWAEITAEDESTTNAWGIIRSVVAGGKSFEVMFGLQIGSLDATSYFDDSDFQLFINGAVAQGGTISSGSMDFDFVGFASGTNVVNLDNFFVQSVGTVSNWDASDTNINELKWTNGQFVDMGTFTFQAQDAGNKFVNDCTWVNCGKLRPSTMDMNNIAFIGASDPNGALELVDNLEGGNLSNVTFTSDGSGHAIELNPTGTGTFTYNFDNWTFSGYGADDTANAAVVIGSGAVANDPDIVINILNGGDTPTVDDTVAGYAGTVTINNAVTVAVEGAALASSIKVIAEETAGTITAGDIILQGHANGADGSVSTSSFNYESAFDPSGLDVRVVCRNSGICFVQQGDAGVYTDYTQQANDPTADDVILFPPSETAGQDAVIIGAPERFDKIRIDLSTVATGTYSLTFNYWDFLSGFVAVSGLNDGTSNLTQSGVIEFTNPGNPWTTQTFNDIGPAYWFQILLTSGSFTQNPLARKLNTDYTRYLPVTLQRTITSSGLTVLVNQTEDTISQF